MILRFTTLGVLFCGLFISACALDYGGEKNPFLTMIDEFGMASGEEGEGGDGGGGTVAQDEFRRTMTVTFLNNHESAEVELSFAAWVNVSSIRTAEQQDALLNGGYVQLSREIQLGTAFTLPVGTFIYNGPGFAGATSIRLGCPLLNSAEATSNAVELITPDVFLLFSQPPVSCDSVAFSFIGSRGGAVTGPVMGSGGYKTLAQVDVYQCDPLRPGLFLKLGGGARQENEFFEGENALFEFNQAADVDGNFAIVTISED